MTARTRIARFIRRVTLYPIVPTPVEHVLRRLAYRVSPHTLRCRLCGEVFVAESAFSLAHARRAYDHYVAVHESAASEQSEFDTE